MACNIFKGVILPFDFLQLGKNKITVGKSVEEILTSPDVQEINKLCVVLEIIDCFDVFLKMGLELLHSEVLCKIHQKLKVEKIPDFNSAAEEKHSFKSDMGDDFRHSLVMEWDVLFVTETDLVEEYVYIRVCYTSMLQSIDSKMEEVSKIVFQLLDSFQVT